MMLGKWTIKPALREWLQNTNKTLFLDVNNKGCNGHTLVWEVKDRAELFPHEVSMSERFLSLIKDGLQIEADYIIIPSYEGVQLYIAGNVCGCGKSFSV